MFLFLFLLLNYAHISAAGGIKNAVQTARNNVSFVRKIEVEVDAKEDIIILI